jgi:hypothetical protein
MPVRAADPRSSRGPTRFDQEAELLESLKNLLVDAHLTPPAATIRRISSIMAANTARSPK